MQLLCSNADADAVRFNRCDAATAGGSWRLDGLRCCGRSGATVRVLAVRYSKVHEANAIQLRPWWQRADSGEWAYTMQRRTLTAEQWQRELASAQLQARMKAR